MKPRDTDIPIEFLHECLIYDPDHGTLTWRERPRSHFVSFKAWRTWNGRYAGTVAGALNGYGYRRVRINWNGYRKATAHRIAWAMTHGAWPTDRIDHRYGNRDDNRIGVLREASFGQNHQNKARYKNNTSGYTGVSFDKSRWAARIRVNNKIHFLGYFDTPQEAHKAYLAAKQELHKFQPQQRRVIIEQ